jgi:hypothetical protein
MLVTRRAATTVLTLATLAVTVLSAAPATAGDDDANRNSGSCSAGTDWKIKAKADDGRIEVEAEVDSNKVGQSWAWKLKDNGVVVATGSSTTQGPSGSFSVERKPANRAGTDSFVFRAVHAGEVCRATVAW